MTPEQIDAASRAVAKTPNRVSLEFIESQIDTVSYRTGAECVQAGGGPSEGPLAHLTVAFMVMKNGFIVIGHAAPMDPANFNVDHGRKLAYDQCIKQLWPLYAFARLEGQDSPAVTKPAAGIHGTHKFIYSYICENGCGATQTDVEDNLKPKECPAA